MNRAYILVLLFICGFSSGFEVNEILRKAAFDGIRAQAIKLVQKNEELKAGIDRLQAADAELKASEVELESMTDEMKAANSRLEAANLELISSDARLRQACVLSSK